MVRDEKGEKMSKSKGNVIDPLVLIDQHGADPLRFTLAAMAGQGRDIKLSVDRVEGYRAFCNKLWNATKFLHLQFEPAQGGPVPEPAGGVAHWIHEHRPELSVTHRWIISLVQTLAEKVEKGLVGFEINEAAASLYEFTWREFCDWYIEFAKLPLREGGDERLKAIYTTHYILEKLLRLMHPFMPFVTEELWLSLPWRKPANTPARKRDQKPEVETIMFQEFPKANRSCKDADAETSVRALKGIVEAIRNFRGENSISPKVEFRVRYRTTHEATHQFITTYEEEIAALSRVAGLERVGQDVAAEATEAIIPITAPQVELRIDLKGLVDIDGEKKRLEKEIEKVTEDIAFVQRKLSQESFISRAPAELVAKERGREQELIAKRTELESALGRLARLGAKV
jgi:valyl-tRNA synthetase